MFENCVLIGGDLRQKYLLQMLRKDGFKPNWIHGQDNLQNNGLLKNASTVILPYPTVKEGKLFTVFTQNAPPIDEVLKHISPNATVFGAKIEQYLCPKQSVNYVDYELFDELTENNARLTAEAAVSIIIKKCPFTLLKCPILVVGYGRIGGYLAQMLKSIGAKVTVSARKSKKRCIAENNQLTAINFEEMSALISHYSIIINTVPNTVIDRAVLGRCKQNVYILDLASPPYGVDFETAEKMKIVAEKAPGLPGKYKPLAAAENLYRVIMRQSNRKEVVR